MTESKYKPEIEKLRAELAELYQKRADELCPFKVGDTLTDGRHTAKVTAVKPRESDYSPYEVLGVWILKDGSTSDLTRDLSWGYKLKE